MKGRSCGGMWWVFERYDGMGINIGYVRKLELGEKHVNVQILVTAKNVKIPNGTIARVEFYGLGGSKSIELMPAEAEVGNFGIVTTKTLRLHDIAMKAEDLVDIVEVVERLVKGINKSATKNALEKISNAKEDKIQSVNSDMSNFKQDFVKKSKSLREKEADVVNKIDNMNDNVDKINKFIKK